MKAHIIKNGIVENTIVVDELKEATEAFPDAIVIEATVGGPGWIYSNGRLVEPAPKVEDTTKITRFAFRGRFTQAEKITLELASRETSGAMLKVYLDDIAAATYIDLAMQETRNGVNALENLGLIGKGRAAEILDTPVTEIEAYRAGV